MPAIVGILTFMSTKKIVLSWVEHGKRFYNLRAWSKFWLDFFSTSVLCTCKQLCRLAWAFVTPQCDKYRNLMCWHLYTSTIVLLVKLLGMLYVNSWLLQFKERLWLQTSLWWCMFTDIKWETFSRKVCPMVYSRTMYIEIPCKSKVKSGW